MSEQQKRKSLQEYFEDWDSGVSRFTVLAEIQRSAWEAARTLGFADLRALLDFVDSEFQAAKQAVQARARQKPLVVRPEDYPDIGFADPDHVYDYSKNVRLGDFEAIFYATQHITLKNLLSRRVETMEFATAQPPHSELQDDERTQQYGGLINTLAPHLHRGEAEKLRRDLDLWARNVVIRTGFRELRRKGRSQNEAVAILAEEHSRSIDAIKKILWPR